jgi:hypothetical protein
MIFLFRSGTVQDKLKLIFRATRTHAQNLAKYATVYKLTMLALKHMGSEPGKEGPYDTFFAGLLGGYLIFGRRSKRGHVSSVSKQIVIFGKPPAFLSFPTPPCQLIPNYFLRSICTRLPLPRKTLNRAFTRHNQEPRTLETNIPRRMASLRGA